MGAPGRKRRPEPQPAAPAVATIDRVMKTLGSLYEIDRFRTIQGPDPFRILVGCIISLRTKDEVTFPATERLFRIVSTPAAMADLDEGRIAEAIYPAGFYNNKAAQIRRIGRILTDEHAGLVPRTIDELVRLPGVGRKTANLTITLGYGLPGICVDIHVHRITNRLGWLRTVEPDRTEAVLRDRLPRRHWIPINETLVRHGQQVCKPVSPHCSSCPVAGDCPRVGVERSR